jgi:sarcosine oxidase subunit beta
MNGVVVATGFGGHGVMHSPAAGMAVSEIVLEGSCTSFDINGLRPSRFAENDLIVEPMVI